MPLAVTYINLLTAPEPGSTTREDQAAVEVALFPALPSGAPRICRIRPTAQLDEMWVSEPLLDEALRDAVTVVADTPRSRPPMPPAISGEV
jgi:hypothetical protein